MLDIKEILRMVKAAKTGTFQLSSGRTSNLYIDGKQLSLDAKALHHVCLHLYNQIEKFQPPEPASQKDRIHAIGGLVLGAAPLVGGLLYCYGLQGISMKGFLVRKESKEHGTKNLIEGPIKPGMNVAIVEDTATTGESAHKAVREVMAFGCNVKCVVSIVDRSEGAVDLFKSLTIPYVYLLDRQAVLETLR